MADGDRAISRKAKASSVFIENLSPQTYNNSTGGRRHFDKRNHNSLPADLAYSFDDCELLLSKAENETEVPPTCMSPMSRIAAFRKELELLKPGSSSDGRSLFTPSTSPDLSMLEFSSSEPRPPPLPVDEPFKILSSSDHHHHIVLPMEEYSIQVAPVTSSHVEQVQVESFSIDRDVSEQIDSEFSLSEFDVFSNDTLCESAEDSNCTIDEGQSATDDGRFTRQKSLEYDHLEPGEEEEHRRNNSKDGVSKPGSNNNYSVTVQFHEASKQHDTNNHTVHSLTDDHTPCTTNNTHQYHTSPEHYSISCGDTTTAGGGGGGGRCHCPVCCSCGSPHRRLSDIVHRKLSHHERPQFHERNDETLSNASWPTCPIERYSSGDKWRPTRLPSTPGVAVSQGISKRLEKPTKDGLFGSSVEISHSSSVIEDELEMSSSYGATSAAMGNGLNCEPDTQSIFSAHSMLSYQSGLTFQSTSNCSIGQPFNKGIDGSLFKDRIELICQWFREFNDHQRNSMLLRLLGLSNCCQMHLLSVEMEPILHQACPHNCQDLLSWLPPSISLRIMGFLDPVSLCRASQVSKLWYSMANDSLLWKRLTLSRNWQLSSDGHVKQMNVHTCKQAGEIQWKSMFAERFRLRRNWLKGYCTVRTFEGHSQGISCVQFDDTRIVSGSWDKTIKVWNRRTNTAWAALTLAGHSGTVRCLHLHGNRLVSGSSDRTIKVWDLATNNVNWVGAACKATMVGHTHTVRCLKADDCKVVSGSYDHTLKIWDIKTGTCTKTLRGHTDSVLCLQFDNEKVISGSKDTTIKVWGFENGQCNLTLHGHEGAVSCLQFDDDRIISGALDRLIKIWNLSTGKCVRTIDWIKSEGHTGVVRHLQADSWKLVSAADDKTLKVWSVQSGERLLTLRSHSDGVTCLQFNDQVIVSGSFDKTVKLWDFSVC